MSLVEAIGEKVINLFSSKKKIALLMIFIVIVAGIWKIQFSYDPEKEYWEHIDAINKLSIKAGNLWDLAKHEDNNTKATSLLIQMKEAHEKALLHAYKAIELAPDEKTKNYAYYLSQSLEYAVKADEKLIEASKSLESGDIETAKNIGKEVGPLIEKSLELLHKADEYNPKLLRRASK